MQIQPQLILLQKTLLNIEGLGRDLYPELDIWNTASPILREWMRERTSLRSLAHELRGQLPEILEAAHKLPALLRSLARRADAAPAAVASGRSELRRELIAAGRRRDALLVGATLFLGAIIWLALARRPLWPGWALLACGAAQLVYGLWRRP